MSSLSRIAVDNHRFVSVDENDTVILSARIIPGNEKAIFRMLDHMFRRRALVYYDNSGGTIHVSGHASQEEQKLMLHLVRPKYFIPVHGEYRQLFRHAALAHQLGVVSGEILLIEDGQTDRIHRRRRLPPRSGHRRTRLRRFRFARRNRRSRHSRPQASFRRRRRRADHRHRQAHRPNGIAAGNRDARTDERQWPGTDRRRARSHPENRRTIPTPKKNPTGASSRKKSAWT